LEQYLPYIEQAGHSYKVESLLDDNYLKHRFKTGKRNLFAYIKPLLNRLSLFWRVRQFDLVIICVEFLPYFPAIFEKYLKWINIPYIFDYDDPVFHYYDLSHNYFVRLFFGKKFNSVFKKSAHIIGGSPYLVNYAKQFNQQVSYLPTVVSSAHYNQNKDFSTNRRFFTVGWIGSPSTSVYLKLIEPALEKIYLTENVKIILIGAGSFSMESVTIELKEWSEQDEIKMMLDFDVGIMPLSNDAWSEGKCGFKLIQYMACGLPVIASPVGVNNDIIENGCNGFLANTIDEWVQALRVLIYDVGLRESMGKNGRLRFEQHYSLAVTAPEFIKIINQFS
ncbi:MAG: glycosyltransferase family 4 protein, partial [Methylococcaceae bacterium]